MVCSTAGHKSSNGSQELPVATTAIAAATGDCPNPVNNETSADGVADQTASSGIHESTTAAVAAAATSCIRSPAKSPASLAKPGQARLAGLLAGLARKVRPGKASQARPKPGFYGHLGNLTLESPALAGLSGQPWQQKPGFPGHVSSMPGFLGFPGQ